VKKKSERLFSTFTKCLLCLLLSAGLMLQFRKASVVFVLGEAAVVQLLSTVKTGEFEWMNSL